MLNSKITETCCFIPQRYIVMLMCCFSLMISTAMGTSIVIILQELTITKENKVSGNACIRYHIIPKINPILTHNIRLSWSLNIQDFINTAYFWGEILTHIPSGIIADKCGGKLILAFGILIGGIISMLTPFVILKFDAIGLILLRLLLGCCNGCIPPGITSLLSRWVPIDARSRCAVIVYSGAQIGTQLGYVIPLFFMHTFKTLLTVYYLWGFLAIFWFIIFMIFCYNDPNSHPCIKASEVEYLEYEHLDVAINRKNIIIPWKEIFTSIPMQAYFVAIFGHSWCFNMLFIVIPKYYINMLRFTHQETFIRLAISYNCMIFTSILSGFIADRLVKEQVMEVTYSRKFWTIIAFAGSATFLILAVYADCNAFAANILFTISYALFGPWFAGMMLNALDLAPNYSGTIMGLTSSITSIVSFLISPISNIIVSSNYICKWSELFWITFFILCICAVYVGVAADGKVQEWNDLDYIIDNKQNKLMKRLSIRRSTTIDWYS